MVEGARGIQSVEVSGRILSALITFGKPTMLKDLAEYADLKPAQCHAYLTSLKTIGLVHQDWASGLYSAGPFALRLGVSWLNSYAPAQSAIQQLNSLAERFNVRSVITLWGQFGPTIAHSYAGLTQTAVNLRQGSVFSATRSATGRVFLAFDSRPEVEALADQEIKQKSENHGIGAAAADTDLQQRLELIRNRKFDIADGQPIPGVNAISAPIFDTNKRLDFVITAIGTADRLKINNKSDVLAEMLAIAEQISDGSTLSEDTTV